MKKLFLLAVTTFICITLMGTDGFSFKLGGKEMMKNGTGTRTRSIFGTLYYATLWVPAPLQGKTGKEIIEADQPMMIVLAIDSSLITRERFVEATSEGFAKSEASGYASPKKQAFLNLFDKVKISKGDVISMGYAPAGLTTSIQYKETGKTETLGTLAGLDLKKALFAIWLGPNPIQESLKNSLLSGK